MCFIKVCVTVKAHYFNSRIAWKANILLSVGMFHSRTPPTSDVLITKKKKKKNWKACFMFCVRASLRRKDKDDSNFTHQPTKPAHTAFVVSHPSYNWDLSSALLRKRVRGWELRDEGVQLLMWMINLTTLWNEVIDEESLLSLSRVSQCRVTGLP